MPGNGGIGTDRWQRFTGELIDHAVNHSFNSVIPAPNFGAWRGCGRTAIEGLTPTLG